MPLFYLAAGFLGGYLVGRRHGVLAVMRREATSILDSVGRLSNLHTMEDLRFKSGSDKDGVQLVIKTRDSMSNLDDYLR